MERFLSVLLLSITVVFAQTYVCYPDDDANFGTVSGVATFNATAYSWSITGTLIGSQTIPWGIYQYITKSSSLFNVTADFGSLVSGVSPNPLTTLSSGVTVVGSASGTFPILAANNLAGRSVVIYSGADNQPYIACNIGYYLASGNTGLRCYFDDSLNLLSGYVEFTASAINYNVTALSNQFGGPGAPPAWPRIHTNYFFKSISNVGVAFEPTAGYGDVFLLHNLTITSTGNSDTTSVATTSYAAAVAASGTIAGRSVVFNTAPATPPASYCIIGYSTGTITDSPSPAPTPEVPTPPPSTTGDATTTGALLALMVVVLVASLML